MLPPQQIEIYRHIIVAPVVTEKTMRLIDQANQYTFRVLRSANKIQIRRAIELLFGVRVLNVTTMNIIGKKKRQSWRHPEGRTAAWKKAMVTLAQGDRIDVVERA
jgi:large subunit ribosomal protein L23